MGTYKQEGSQLLTWGESNRAKGKSLKQKEWRFSSDIREKFISERVVRCWNSCPERLWMPRPSLEVFKARLDGALGSLGWCEMWRLVALRVAGGWRFVIFQVPSNPGHSVILCFLRFWLGTQRQNPWHQNTQNHRITTVGKDLQDHLIQPSPTTSLHH